MKKTRETRPDISSVGSAADLKRWYWLKDELVQYARECGIKTSGGKFTILDRIGHFLDTGETVWPGDKKAKVTSAFDWHSEALSLETVITDSYKNGQNVRHFFKEHAGEGFRFNIEFMAWMKSNTGKTLADAVAEYKAMRAREKADGFQSQIAEHNQFNLYTRDFLEDNPGLGMSEVRKFWALKRQLPSESGRHVYERSDLELAEENKQ